ncbi:MAG: thiamine pyrophosphate-dependent dehydrogenase E1 component subunit alpha [Verrucomicrobia bacterium]|nr:thiamine pyrophosphate-dependent dehydrogenase E1 component subunit alpha [Verrucomicrobiota bacterium]MBU1735448.1 thiamine pyrophosphate-dependent dehydrogenase E1 component subunit alpha [Verrucomicrobiota bacterium]MBU1856843.1 thiamine pyrophosphate-dependent dehydrogenase E1 component subunit alpha [Verrucomicrobiota bacterium]
MKTHPVFADSYEELFYKALRIRLFEERIIDLYPSDKIQSPVHLSIGQEAVAVGVCQALKPSDLLFCTYRSHAYYLAKGGNMPAMMAELYGKVTGCGRGKAGSMHLAAPEVGLMGCSAVVASTIPHAVGAALAAKIQKQDRVIVAVFGDGATDEGVYHESLNFAALHQLPVIFVCENNGWAAYSKVSARQAYSIVKHAGVYGIPTMHIPEGYDFVKVYETFADIVTQAQRTRSPYFVEVQMFRYMEHVGVGDDYRQGIRSRDELEAWQARDPLMIRKDLVAKYTPAVQSEIDAAVRYAEASPWPGRDELLKDVV